jgi:hypothetical protein
LSLTTLIRDRSMKTVALLGLAMGLVACGSANAQPSLIADAASRSAQAGTARVSITLQDIHEAKTDTVKPFSAAGEIDFSNGLTDLTSPGGFETISSQGSVYTSIPPEVRRRLKLRPRWVLMTDATGDDVSTIGAGVLGTASPADPRAVLGALRQISGSVREFGVVQIRGVKTREFSATVDASKLRASVASAAGAAFEPTRVKIYVGVDGYVRRVSMDVPVPEAEPFELTVDFYDFGANFTPRLPSGADVMLTKDLARLLSSQPN